MIIFTRKKDHSCYRDKTGIVCGKTFTPFTAIPTAPDEGCNDIESIYDIDIDNAVKYMKREGCKFADKLWLIRCIHAGLLHGAVYEAGSYMFDLNELYKLCMKIKINGGADPLDHSRYEFHKTDLIKGTIYSFASRRKH